MISAFRKNEEQRVNKKITEWKSTEFRQKGRPKMRWQDDIKHSLKVMKIYHTKKQDEVVNVKVKVKAKVKVSL